MLFVVQFEDDPKRMDVRERDSEKHFAFLRQHAEHIREAGSIRETENGRPLGSVWIMDMPTKADVEALCRKDPFWIAGLRRSMRVYHWSKPPAVTNDAA